MKRSGIPAKRIAVIPNPVALLTSQAGISLYFIPAYIANTEIVIAEWIETAQELGREIPEPKGRLMFA